jgi:hypothetical protein
VISLCRIVAVGSAIITAAPSSAYGTTIIGMGSGDCGSWIANENNPIADSSQVNWVLGFLSALNSTRPDGVDILAGQSNSGITLAVHNYCVAHPTHWIEDAVIHITNQLVNQHRGIK